VEFLLCLSRTHLDPENHQRAHELLEQPLDWDYLCNTAFWHGTSQLMDRHLTREFAGAVPAEAAAKIREFCDHNVERSLTLARELAAVMTIFQSKGIRALAYKGPCLAKAAYGDLTLRAFGDLDILVFHPDVPVCAQIFRDRGYVLGEHTAVTTTGSEGRIRHEQRFLLHRPPGSQPPVISVELQWAIGQRRYFSRGSAEDFWPGHQIVSIEGVDIPTLAMQDLFPVLCVHGAKHFWRQLKWICDIAEIVAGQGGDLDWTALQRRAVDWDCYRVLLLGLHLAGDMFGITLPPSIREKANSLPAVHSLTAQIKAWMFRAIDPRLTMSERLLFRVRSRERLRSNMIHIWSKLLWLRD
jgi:hypothetical protein